MSACCFWCLLLAILYGESVLVWKEDERSNVWKSSAAVEFTEVESVCECLSVFVVTCVVLQFSVPDIVKAVGSGISGLMKFEVNSEIDASLEEKLIQNKDRDKPAIKIPKTENYRETR